MSRLPHLGGAPKPAAPAAPATSLAPPPAAPHAAPAAPAAARHTAPHAPHPHAAEPATEQATEPVVEPATPTASVAPSLAPAPATPAAKPAFAAAPKPVVQSPAPAKPASASAPAAPAPAKPLNTNKMPDVPVVTTLLGLMQAFTTPNDPADPMARVVKVKGEIGSILRIEYAGPSGLEYNVTLNMIDANGRPKGCGTLHVTLES